MSKSVSNMSWVPDPIAGAENLLKNCVGLVEGQSLLLVCENSRYGHYQSEMVDLVAGVGEDLGAKVFQIAIPKMEGPEDFPKIVGAGLDLVDHAVFFSQAGDQVRFCETPGDATKTMTYTLDIDALGSPFGTVHHGLITEMKELLRLKWSEGGKWRITCPLGTDLRGQLAPCNTTEEDVSAFTVSLFPHGILPPISAETMTGIAASRCVMATQNRRYKPDGLVLDDTVLIQIKNGQINKFDGPAGDIVKDHYSHVSSLFDINPNFVHSWHTGHHPKTHYVGHMSENLIKWGTVTFNSPRYTHLHTCGEYPPGEIAVIIIDATITLNDEILWDAGRFSFTDRPEVQALLSKYPDSEGAFEMLWDIGLGDTWSETMKL